jgi:predicted ribosomally synthesized peptide with nif11-like leader
MSQAKATEFLEKANNDPQLMTKLAELGPDAALEDVLDVAAVSGYMFTEKELMQVAKDRAEAEGASLEQELSVEELEAVAGGLKINLTIIHITKISTKNSVVVTIKSNF